MCSAYTYELATHHNVASPDQDGDIVCGAWVGAWLFVRVHNGVSRSTC